MEEQRVRVAAAAAAEETMALYDACWFRRCVLLPSPLPAPAPGSTAKAQQPVSATPTAALRHRRTRSDESSAAAAFRPDLEPLGIPNNRARLETILSGKDGMVVAAPQPQPRPVAERRRPAAGGGIRRRRQRRGRSMSELEFEELKGLQDLGFTFSDAEVDAELASVVPGLRRKKPSGEETKEPAPLATASAPAAAPRRPYLSEAWDYEEERVRAMLLRDWRIPAAVDGADLKEHLRVWAHTVASAVR